MILSDRHHIIIIILLIIILTREVVDTGFWSMGAAMHTYTWLGRGLCQACLARARARKGVGSNQSILIICLVGKLKLFVFLCLWRNPKLLFLIYMFYHPIYVLETVWSAAEWVRNDSLFSCQLWRARSQPGPALQLCIRVWVLVGLQLIYNLVKVFTESASQLMRGWTRPGLCQSRSRSQFWPGSAPG